MSAQDNRDETTADQTHMQTQHLSSHLPGGLTVATCAIFMVGAIVGSGVLALPKAVEDLGYLGIALIVFCCLSAAYTGHVLGRCWLIVQQRYPEMRGPVRYPYPAIAQRTFGKVGRMLVSVLLHFTLFGVAVVVLLLAAQNVHLVVKQLAEVDVSFCYWLLAVGGVLIPCTWPGTPKDFWPVAVGALVTTSAVCLTLVVCILIDHFKKETVKPAEHRDFDPYPFTKAFGTVLFAFGGHGLFPTFQTDMKQPEKFTQSCVIAYLVVFIMYIPVAVAGFFVYGRDVSENILSSVSSSVGLYIVLIVMAAYLAFNFIIMINPICQDLEELLHIERKFNWKRAVTRTMICLLIIFIAESVPRFGAILAFIGGFSGAVIVYIIPIGFYFRLGSMKGDWAPVVIPIRTKVINAVVVVLGILGGAAATYSALREIVSSATFTPPCYVNVTAANG